MTIENMLSECGDPGHHPAFCLDFQDVFDVSKSEIFATTEGRATAIENWIRFSDQLPSFLPELRWRRTAGKAYILNGVPERNGDPYYLGNFNELDQVFVTVGNYRRRSLVEELQAIFAEVRLRENFLKRAHQLRSALPQRYIGCHYRNTDYKNDFGLFAERVEHAAQTKNIPNIFIATDDVSSRPKFQEALSGFNLHFNDVCGWR
jgi:hypothetical protein